MFRLGFDEGKLWVMLRGLIECLEEVWSWLEGLVPRENAGESWLVRAANLAILGIEPQYGCGAPRLKASGREGGLCLSGAPRRSRGGRDP